MLYFSRKKITFKKLRLSKVFTKVLEQAYRDVCRKSNERTKSAQDDIIIIPESQVQVFQYVDTLSEWQVSVALARSGLSNEEVKSIPDKVRRLILFDILLRLHSRD
jgi:hypothetical protein